MKVVCDSCASEYRIDEKKIPASGGAVTCKKCNIRIKVAAPSIALKGSEAKAAAPASPAIALAGGAGAANSGAIPLAGDTSMAAESAIPLAAGTPSPEDSAIPLAGGAPSPGDSAIPLAGGAPSPTDTAIPLAGGGRVAAAPPAPPPDFLADLPPTSPASMPPGPTDEPQMLGDDDITSMPLADDSGFELLGDLPAADEPLAPLPDTGRRTEDTSIDQFVALGEPVSPAAVLPASAVDNAGPDLIESLPAETGGVDLLADLPPAGDEPVDLLADLPAPDTGGDDLLGDLPPQAASGVDLLEDLPAPDVGGADLLDDLPPPSSGGGADLFDDLPAPDGQQDSLLDDLPPLASSGADLLDDLPAPADGAASGVGDDLFDDLPTPNSDAPAFDDLPPAGAGSPGDDELFGPLDEPNAPMGEIANDGGEAPAFGDLPEASSRSGDPFADAMEPMPGPADDTVQDLAAGAGAKAEKSKKQASSGRSRRGLYAVAAALIFALAAVPLADQFLGIQLIDPALLGLGPAKDGNTGDGSDTSQDGGKEGNADNTGAKENSGEPSPPPGQATEAVELTRETVISANFATLAAFADAQSNSAERDEPLLAWTRYRLAAAYGDAGALDALVNSAPTNLRSQSVDPMTAAAALGASLLQGKAGPAKKLAERLRRKHPASPELAYIAARALDGQGRRAIPILTKTIERHPQHVDARLALARIVLDGPKAAAAVEDLVKLAEQVDMGMRLKIADALAGANHFLALPKILGKAPAEDDIEALPAGTRGIYFRYKVRAHLFEGMTQEATAVSERWSKLEPDNASATIEHARLQWLADPKAGLATLTSGLDAATNVADKGRLLAEAIRLHLSGDQTEQASALLSAHKNLEKGASAGWLLLTKGRLAEKAGRTREAKTAYTAATRGRPNFADPRLAQILLSPGNAGSALPRLSQLSKLSNSATVDYQLAKVMLTRGNPGGAAALLESVLWRDPTIMDPIALLLEWVDSMSAAEINTRARERVDALHRARPGDTRPVQTLVTLAKNSRDAEEISRWYRVLSRQEPKVQKHKLGLAHALIDADKHSEARAVLDEIASKRAHTNSPELLYALARAWEPQDEIKARSFLIEAKIKKPSAEIFMLLGSIDEKRSKYDNALEAYRDALKFNPQMVEAQLASARILMSKGYAGQADVQLRALLKNDRFNLEAIELLGDAAADLDKPREALRSYQKLADKREAPASIHMKIARIQLQDLDQVGPAVRSLRRSIARQPVNPDAYYMLGYALKDQNKRGEARSALKKFIEQSDNPDMIKEVTADLNAL